MQVTSILLQRTRSPPGLCLPKGIKKKKMYIYILALEVMIIMQMHISNCLFFFPLYITISSSCRAISTDISDPFSPPFSIIHCFWQVLRTTFHISTELLYIGSSWLSCLCSSMWRDPQEYITYEFVLTSPAVSHMSGSSNSDSFCDGW